MRFYLCIALALLASVGVALCGVGDLGVSQGFSTTEPVESYPGVTGVSQASGPATVESSIPQTGGYYGGIQPTTTQTYPGISSPLGSAQTGGYSASTPGSWYTSQDSQSAGTPTYGYPGAGSSNAGYSNVGSSDVGYQSAEYPSGAPQIGGPYEERLSATDLNLDQPQADSFQPEGSLDFKPASLPSSISFDADHSTTGTSGTGSWYWPGRVVSRNKFYAQTTSGLKTVAGCSYGGYIPLWSDVTTSGNFYTYEWYPGEWTPKVRWWGWTSRGYKKGWFHGDAAGWHILSYHCTDWSNYVYVYVWPSGSARGSSQGSGHGSGYAGYQGMTTPGTGNLPSGAPTPPNPDAEGLILPDFNQVSSNKKCTGQGCNVYTPKPVYPSTVSNRCNEYYIQVWPNKLTTAAGVKRGEYLQLWSKIGRPGDYWSFEWTPCGTYPSGYYCFPEVKNFGYKGTGWYPTWFSSSHLGWHILTFNCNDWSNYVYIYVWPTS